MSVYSKSVCQCSNLKIQQNFDRTELVIPTTITKHQQQLYRKKRVRLAFIWRCLILIGVVFVFYLYNILTNPIIPEKVQIQLKNSVENKRYFDFERKREESLYHQHRRRHLLSALSFAAIAASSENAGSSNTKNSKENCTKPAILDFPWDGFNRQERQHGWIILHMLIAIYLFWLLAFVCDEYFVPAIEHLCETLYLSADVIGATFMAIATASPELFMNLIGTFVTHGDIGLGTTVGSAVFNVLVVPAACGILVCHYIMLDWGPLVRDCLLYGIAILALLVTMIDGRIMWYESLFLVMCYVLYIIFMMNSARITSYFKRIVRNWKGPNTFRPVNEFSPLLVSSKSSRLAASSLDIVTDEDSMNDDATGYASSPWQPRDPHTYWILHILRWPITFWLWLTIPDSRRHPRLTYLTLVMCIVWIGVVSYMVAYAITIIGDTMYIPDSVMGLTVLAAGMSVPEAVSSMLVTRQGRGTMGISNALGSNTFDILLCLGLPWFVKAFFFPDHVNEPWITLNSGGLIYATVFLMTSLLGLFVAIIINKFILDWRVGVACLLMYVAFLLIAVPMEMKNYESIVMCEVA